MKIKKYNFLKNYYLDLSKLLSDFDNDKFLMIIDQLKKLKKNNKLILAGNGGSASIANHVAVDFTKIAGIRSITFNESNLITCFANDYGYENWVSQSLKNFATKGDMCILISSSGKSKNIINAAKECKKKKYFFNYSYWF